MTPTVDQRTATFAAFSRALFRADVEALYETVTEDFLWSYHDGLGGTKVLNTAAAVAEHLAEQRSTLSAQRIDEVVFRHLPALTLLTFSISETVRATGERREQRGVELYTFKDGKIASKDVYRKPAQP